MTIEQILNSENKSNEFTNKFVFKSLKTQAASCFSNLTNNFMGKVSEIMISISQGDADRLGYYSCRKGNPAISDELKKELLLSLKEIVKKEVENYKKDIDFVFGSKEKIEEPAEKKVEIEIQTTPKDSPDVPVPTSNSSLFGY